MNWNDRFAHRTAHMRRSAIRELLKVTAKPEMISFAGGLPAPELFPTEELRAAAQVVLGKQGAQALQYGQTEGIVELRDWIAHKFTTPDLPLSRENVVIFNGAQQALDLVGRVLLNEGDRVIVENPTYLALLLAWRPLGVEFLPLAGDANGLRLDALEELLPLGPKLLYTIPNFQNPQGTTLGAERRRQLVARLRQAGVTIVEDNPYGDLRYSGEAPPHLLELDAVCANGDPRGSNVIYAGTFSKVLAPGLRVGWVIAPVEVTDKLTLAKQAADLHSCTLSQHLIWTLLRDGALERQIPNLREAYRVRRDAMLSALSRYFPKEVHWTQPDGGMFLMVTLPEGWDAAELLRESLQRQVAFVPGEEFHVNGQGRNTLRLNFSNATPERIEEGIRRLAGALE
jgi:2-aminoadipate transaminase